MGESQKEQRSSQKAIQVDKRRIWKTLEGSSSGRILQVVQGMAQKIFIEAKRRLDSKENHQVREKKTGRW